MNNLTPQKIGLMIGGVILTFAGLFGAWKITSKPTAPTKVDIVLNEHDSIKGAPEASATATLVEYSDFQCPACKAFQPILSQVIEKNKDKVRLVYRHFPLESIHKNARAAAYASEAAARQGKFWELHDELFKNQADWEKEGDPNKKFEGYIKNIKGDVERFKNDLKELSIQEKVDRDYASGVQFGVNATPTFFLNGTKLENVTSADDFQKAIDAVITAKK